MCQTLTFLNLAGNSLRDDVNNLYNFLAQPNTLKTLDLSATECAIDAVSYKSYVLESYFDVMKYAAAVMVC